VPAANECDTGVVREWRVIGGRHRADRQRSTVKGQGRKARAEGWGPRAEDQDRRKRRAAPIQL